MNDFKFPVLGLPFSQNPNPSSIPIVLVERETADIPETASSEYKEQMRREITRGVLDAFYEDLNYVHYSAMMQTFADHAFNGEYDLDARKNRERIAADLALEAERMKWRLERCSRQ